MASVSTMLSRPEPSRSIHTRVVLITDLGTQNKIRLFTCCCTNTGLVYVCLSYMYMLSTVLCVILYVTVLIAQSCHGVRL